MADVLASLASGSPEQVSSRKRTVSKGRARAEFALQRFWRGALAFSRLLRRKGHVAGGYVTIVTRGRPAIRV
jgi:hypothetical protein